MLNWLKSRRKKKDYREAVIIVTSTIKEDPDLWRAYSDNIAMAFYDECQNNKALVRVSRENLHRLSNQAATNFLKIWLKDVG